MTEVLELKLAEHGFPGKIVSSLYSTEKVRVYKVQTENGAFVVKNITYPASFPYERAIAEVEITLRLDHPNIVKTFSHFWFSSSMSTWQLVILFECCQRDLMTEIHNRKQHNYMLTEAELLSLFSQLADAFAYLQSNGIVHRDIKPQNILCNDKTLKVTDFGTAKNCSGFSMRMYRAPTVTGTPYYMSPILKQGLLNRVAQVPHNEIKSDVYSLGLTFLVMARLETPITITYLQSMNRIASQEIALIPYSDRLKEVLAWMLVEEEEKRCNFLELHSYLGSMCAQPPPALPVVPVSGCCQHVALSPEESRLSMPCHGMLCSQCVEVIPLSGEQVRYRCKLCSSFRNACLRAPGSLNVSVAHSEEAKAANDSISSEPTRNKAEDSLCELRGVEPGMKVSCDACKRVRARKLLLPLQSQLLCRVCIEDFERKKHFAYGRFDGSLT